MASINLSGHQFLVFPTGNSVFIWRVAAVQSNRTISRHKLLENAVDKASRLNVRALMPAPQFAEFPTALHAKERGTCDSWFASSDSAVGEPCDNTASVGDLDSGTDKCLLCWRSL